MTDSKGETATPRTPETSRDTHLDRAKEAIAWLDHIATQEEDLATVNKMAADRLCERAAQIHGWAATVRWLIEREQERS